MALPSQTSRVETWRSSGSSGNSPFAAVSNLIRQNKVFFVGGLAVAIGVGGWIYLRPAAATAAAGADAPQNSDTFLPAPKPQQLAAKPSIDAAKPATISMGMLNDEKPITKPSGGTSLDDLIAESGTRPQPATGGQPGNATPPSTTNPADTNAPVTAVPTDPLNTPPAQPSVPAAQGAEARSLIEQANRLIQQNQPLEARKLLNDALMNSAISGEGRASIRGQIATINETLFFSPTAVKGDTLTDEHAVASGETLGKIVRKEGLPIDWRLLVRINKMPTENSLRVGQKLKVVRQPLHAVVHKSTYRMDIYAGAPASGGSTGPDGQDAGWTYIRSFRVGLGESNGTPEGTFVVKANSKLVNPKWVNPRTGEVFQADDPKNPIGERWIGLEGIDENTRKFTGYGVHGTVDPDSIGQQKSMGCVRLSAGDVEMVYEMLVDRISTVKIMQ